MPDGFIVQLPCIVKARKDGEKRFVEVEASNEEVDSEGDVIRQKALLDSADSFIKTGHFDLDHISELGPRLGIPDSSSYIIGRPTEVKDLGDKRTGVVGEIRRSLDGISNPKANRFDDFWDSLQSDPPVRWQASIYGFPVSGNVEDCRDGTCKSGATRYDVKGIEWRSLAFTRNPINTSIKGYAKIITAKAYVEDFRKDMGFGGGLANAGTYPTYPAAISCAMPRNMDDLWGQYSRHISKDCAFTGGENTCAGFRNHFVMCAGCDPAMAEIYANALMHEINRERKRD